LCFRTGDAVELKSKQETEKFPSLSGYLYKRDPTGLVKEWKKRYFLLKGHRLYYSAEEQDINQPIGFIDLNSPFVVRSMKSINQNVFSVATPNRNYLLQVESHEEMPHWISGLTEVKQQFLKRAKNQQSWIREIQKNEKEGYLNKQGGLVKTWKRRWFVMRSGFLHYFTQKTNGGLERRGTIPLYSARIESTVSSHLVFHIVTKHRTYYLHADFEADTKDWLDAIRKHKSETELRVNSIYINE